MTMIIRAKTSETVTVKDHAPKYLLLAFVALFLALVVPAANCAATLTNFQYNAWNANDQHVLQNGGNIDEPAASFIPGNTGADDFFFVRDSYYKFDDEYFSGAGISDPRIYQYPQTYQHVYAYTLSHASTTYTAMNSADHTQTFNFLPEDINNKKVKRIRYKEPIILNGQLLLTTRDYTGEKKDFVGHWAFFELRVNREIEKRGKIKSKKLLYGSVLLIRKLNGKIRIKTRGAIKKRHLDITPDPENDLFIIEFNDKKIYYSTRAKVGQEFSIVTTINSKAVTSGYSTGAEVIFGPGDPVIPDYQNTGVIPEPATLILLGLGSFLLLRRRKRLKTRNCHPERSRGIYLN